MVEHYHWLIGHLQIADNPGRHEPGTGEINFPFLFDRIDRLGYAGWVGCEYRPLGDTHRASAGLPHTGRLPEFLERASATSMETIGFSRVFST
jgi:hydroxypyruvate isomerase